MQSTRPGRFTGLVLSAGLALTATAVCAQSLLIENVTLIDGTGAEPRAAPRMRRNPGTFDAAHAADGCY